MEVVEHSSGKTTKTVFDGQWKCDKFEGHGTIIYASGDVYKGSVKEGKPHGQGVLKQGKFMGSGASVYVGEWSLGFRNGYGVLDDIVAGEKYMGMWCNDMKSGSGCVVTLDGVYYEGTFSHGKMTGRGLVKHYKYLEFFKGIK
jgi:amyotrophic lateral sclerosis 2 protein